MGGSAFKTDRDKASVDQGRFRKWGYPLMIASASLFASALFADTVKADALDICREGADAVNQAAPMDIGSGAILQNAVCVMDGTEPRLIYRIKLDVAEGMLNQSDISQLKNEQLNSWCTHPSTRPLLEVMNVRYLYTDRSTNYVGQTNISIHECAK